MELHAKDITIAITVFNRRDFILEAVRSALGQTIPVKVIVVEDCGPDSTLRDFVLKEFGNRIQYFRNPKNRGLFDNWNACMEYAQTPWLSILHDDDLLRPKFIQTMLALGQSAPDRALYFGRQAWMERGEIFSPAPVSWKDNWREIDTTELAEESFLLFPGNLFRIADAQAVGGFYKQSCFTGDWEMWFRLALRFGAAQSAAEVAVARSHEGLDRGTMLVVQNGCKWALDNMQRKRNLALLKKEKGIVIPFDRAKSLQKAPVPSRLLFRFAGRFSRRVLRYNAWLFTHSRPPHFGYRILQWLVRAFGPNVFRLRGGDVRK